MGVFPEIKRRRTAILVPMRNAAEALPAGIGHTSPPWFRESEGKKP
jgi:hypothetical protein